MTATMGPAIPPSIPFIVYGALANHPVQPFPMLRQVPGILFDGIIPVALPAFFIVSIITGFATVTGIAALAVAYAMFVGLFVYRAITLKDLPDILGDAARVSAIILITLATAASFSWAMTVLNIGPQLAGAVRALELGPIAILLPITTDLGIDPVHLCLIVVMNLMIGLLAPPVRLNPYVNASIAGRPFEAVMQAVLAFFAALIGVLLLCTLWPGLVLYLPRPVREWR